MNYGTTGFGHTDLTFATHTLSDVNTAPERDCSRVAAHRPARGFTMP